MYPGLVLWGFSQRDFLWKRKILLGLYRRILLKYGNKYFEFAIHFFHVGCEGSPWKVVGFCRARVVEPIGPETDVKVVHWNVTSSMVHLPKNRTNVVFECVFGIHRCCVWRVFENVQDA